MGDKHSTNQVKRDFGSFHSSNLKDQIEFADSDKFVPPTEFVHAPQFEEYKSEEFHFGHAAKRKHFYLEDECTFLNHGAFGATLKQALEYSQEWQKYAERQPLRFFDRLLFPQTINSQRRIAKFVGCKTSDIVLVGNVTTAVNAVLQGLDLSKSSRIYFLNITYGAVKKTIRHICNKSGATMQEEKLSFPLKNEEDILNLVEETLLEGTTLAVFDHIPSNYAFVMPVKKIVGLCHKKNVPVFIDGAHALGTLPLNLRDLNADYYTTNAHKWFLSCKGCALLYVREELQAKTKGLIVSHGFESGFHEEFSWTGLKDYTAFLSLHACLNFWQSVGVDKIREYIHNLLREAIDLLRTRWDAMLLVPEHMLGSMCCVSLPNIFFEGKKNLSYSDGESVQNVLYHKYNIEVPIKCIDNKLYVRISAHVHNEISDYENLAVAILEMAK